MAILSVEVADHEELKQRFIDICGTINRPGMEDLMKWLENSDFYVAPASSHYHGCYAGGLLEHSLNVYDTLSALVARYPELGISAESVAVVALFHDLTKVNYYYKDFKNVKVYSEHGLKHDANGNFNWESQPTYKVDDKMPLGHGEKSVIILQSFIKLTRDEVYAIRRHMGAFDAAVKGGDSGMNKAFELCPLAAMAHLADMEATYLLEARKSVSNDE